mmetsp:Transcript_30087/g.36746  ORF Transcript_30087/g.36746 Transcript_30087/m.36746 type:complete len:326 (-) Transcript_30087:80-1057(-)
MRLLQATRIILSVSGAACFIIPSRNNNGVAKTRTSSLSMGILLGGAKEEDPDDVQRDFMGLRTSGGASTDSAAGERWGYRDQQSSSNSMPPSEISEPSWRSETEVALGGNDDPDDLMSAVKAAVKQSEAAEEEEERLIPVRFVNFDTHNPLRQKTVHAAEGTNILKISDEAGVRIPRQCRSGLCGSCTADVKDPTWEDGDRAGYQTVRTCLAGAMLPAGCEEMVIDCYRLVDTAAPGEVTAGGPGAAAASTRVSTAAPSMKNFEDGWEADFVPDYMSGGRAGSEITVSRSSSKPEYTVGEKQEAKKLKRWFPKSSDNIAPWDIVW